jgi:hypothetical protein
VRVLREDVAIGWIAALFAVSQLTAIGWDLPGSYGWENDGIAPRDFFAGIGINLTPGQGHRYPLFHNLVLGLLSLPVLLPAALRATEWTLPAIMEQVLAVPTMTGVSIIAKLLSIVMACVSILTLARMARRTVSLQAGRWAAIWAATSLSFAYYGRVSNLDGPYLMWTVLAMDRLLTVAESRGRKDYVWFGVFAGAAVATKDQAYAGFVLTGLVYLLLVPLRKDLPFGPRAKHYRNTAWATLAGTLSLGTLGGGFLNPTGFISRFRELTGGASHNWMTYARTPEGVTRNLIDIFVAQESFFWPWPIVALCWLGLWITLTDNSQNGIRSRTFRLLPFCAAVSSLLFFTLIVARCEHRFLLPFGFWLSYYGGVAAAALLKRAAERGVLAQRLTYVTGAALVVWGAAHSFEVHLTQRGDARKQVTEYLASLEPGSVVETYHLLVHLPHFDVSEDSPYRVQRVSRRPIAERNPLVGALELDEPYGNIVERRPDVLVVPEFSAREFLPRALRDGEVTPAVLAQNQQDADARAFFGAIVADSLNGYEVTLIAEPTFPPWAAALGLQPVRVHQSVGNRQWILVRSGRHDL